MTLTVHAPEGMPDVPMGTGLPWLVDAIAQTLTDTGCTPQDGDILVITSKVVSKALGLSVTAPNRTSVVQSQTIKVVAARRIPGGVTAVVESHAGPVVAAAGVDASNVSSGEYLLLPHDTDAIAEEIAESLQQRFGLRIGVIISDTAGRPWRMGVSDYALGCARVMSLEDLRGTPDDAGFILDVTVRAIADEIASAADLVKGKTGGRPIALVSGVQQFVTEVGIPARQLIRTGQGDWFATGAYEAVRAALGVSVGVDDILSGETIPPIDPEDDAARALRAIRVAQDSPARDLSMFRIEYNNGFHILAAPQAAWEDVDLGYLIARLEVSARSENLEPLITVSLPDRNTSNDESASAT